MNKINWIKKLTSRKFWIALIGFISSLLVAFNVDAGSVEQITSIIMSGATLIAYILAEGFVDAANVNISIEKKRKNNGLHFSTSKSIY